MSIRKGKNFKLPANEANEAVQREAEEGREGGEGRKRSKGVKGGRMKYGILIRSFGLMFWEAERTNGRRMKRRRMEGRRRKGWREDDGGGRSMSFHSLYATFSTSPQKSHISKRYKAFEFAKNIWKKKQIDKKSKKIHEKREQKHFYGLPQEIINLPEVEEAKGGAAGGKIWLAGDLHTQTHTQAHIPRTSTSREGGKWKGAGGVAGTVWGCLTERL